LLREESVSAKVERVVVVVVGVVMLSGLSEETRRPQSYRDTGK